MSLMKLVMGSTVAQRDGLEKGLHMKKHETQDAGVRKLVSRASCETVAAAALLLQGCLVVGGVSVPQTAEASGGACKWEGGPGGAGCEIEDCLEDGGRMMCREPEPRPPVSDADADSGKFGYSACDVRGPNIPAIAQWCRAMGGEWTGRDELSS